MFNELRRFIINNLEIDGIAFRATDKTDGQIYDAVYLVEKPETHETTSGNYLLIKWNQNNGGHTVRSFTVEIWIMTKDLGDNCLIANELVNLLDFYNRPCEISKYKKFVLSNEGGTYYNDNIHLYTDKLFFECKLI